MQKHFLDLNFNEAIIKKEIISISHEISPNSANSLKMIFFLYNIWKEIDQHLLTYIFCGRNIII